MREHRRLLDDAGVPDSDKPKQAAIFTIVSFSKSAPTLYWTLWELFSRPDVLARVRAELAAHAVALTTDSSSGDSSSGDSDGGGGGGGGKSETGQTAAGAVGASGFVPWG
ncbi:hypothetical protein N657DRAFT_694030 [Parathielavia appendiculata]|uniref:Uncharacterized protein n=1 Tax=Parathielavia appendiculata TaxID=2587402 RepID=A0AAN6YZ65_9PEZI|nr:hypothetical protein N657DRAFT_694030 [Parathielavia appendiculata]